jgi:hypothetical protein
MNLFLLAVISHLISDFLYQSKKIVDLKVNKNIKVYFLHAIIIFACTFILTGLYGFKIAFKFALILSIIHVFIDFLKEKISNGSSVVELHSFIVDQLLHIISIFLLWRYFKSSLTVPVFLMSDSLNIFNINTSITQILIFVIFYITILFAGAVLLEKVLNIIDVKIDNQEGKINMGKYVGIIERALILTLVTFGSLSSIGIIFTAKSLARFKKLEEKHFVEYYLLGTLTSIFMAVVGGLLLKNLIN